MLVGSSVCMKIIQHQNYVNKTSPTKLIIVYNINMNELSSA